MSYFSRFFKDIRIRHKILASFLALTILITVVVGLVCYSYASRVILDKTTLQARETIYQLSENIEHNVRLINEKLSYLAYNPKIQNLLNTDRSSLDERGKNAMERDMGRMMVLTYSSISLHDLEIIPNEGDSFYISSYDNPLVFDEEESFIDMAHAQRGRNVMYNDLSSDSVQIVKEINDLTRLTPLGTMRASLKKDLIESTVREIDFASEGSIFVLDANGHPVVGDKNLLPDDPARLFTQMSGRLDYTANGKDYVMVYAMSEYTYWITVGLLPREALQREVLPLQLVIVVLGLVVVLLCVGLSQLLSRVIVGPLDGVVAALDDFSAGDLERQLPVGRKDEIGRLREGFNRMSNEITRLINTIYNKQVLLRESEFKALQAQINPHFLYNTLDTINWMAHKEGMDTVSNMVSAVSSLMRASISNRQQFVSVDDELHYVREYLYIQQVRYQDKLFVSIDVDPALGRQMVPKLILQPIVENSVVHGIEGSKKGGSISLTGRRIGEHIVFTISDSGMGIPPEKLASLLAGPAEAEPDAKHSHMGLYTVHQRVRYLYGEAYGLRIQSAEGEGTTVMLEIPYYDDPNTIQQFHREKHAGPGAKEKG